MRISDWSSDVCSSDLHCCDTLMNAKGFHRNSHQKCILCSSIITVEGKWLHFRIDLDHYEHSLTLAPRNLANYTPLTHTCHQPLHVATSTAHAIILSCNNLTKCTTPPRSDEPTSEPNSQ